MRHAHFFSYAAALTLFFLAGTADGGEAKNLLIVVDSSSSMAETTPDGIRRYEVVRESLSYLVDGLSGDINLGMIAYGHRSKEEYGKNDIEMIIPIGPLDPSVVKLALKLLKPKGLSPIAAALRKGAEALAKIEGRSCILLVTDGKENCGGDPVEAARWIREDLGVSIVIDVVGLNVNAVAKEQLDGIARSGGGKFHGAQDAIEMRSALIRSANGRTGAYKGKKGIPKSKSGGMLGSKSVDASDGEKIEAPIEKGKGKVMLHYVNTAPKSITIFDQETDEKVTGSGMWAHLQGRFKTSLNQGVYRFELELGGGLEPLIIRNVVIRANRETSVNID